MSSKWGGKARLTFAIARLGGLKHSFFCYKNQDMLFPTKITGETLINKHSPG